MNEDDPPPSRDNDSLLYDWFKYLTTMSLLALGGVLSLSQVPDGDDIKLPVLVGVIVVIAFAGLLAFSGADQFVRARLAGRPLPTQVYVLQKVAGVSLAFGVGGFLYLFAKAMA